MGEDARIGLVVLTYNRVGELLRSLQHLPGLPEQPAIVVVDNASTDGTADAVERRFPRVRCLRLPSNLGAAGRNAGVRACGRPYIAFSDDDTWWEPGSLGHAADLLDAHPRLAVVTGRVLVGESGRLAPACQLMAASPLVAPPEIPGASLLGFHAGASVIRRSAFLEAGGYEERFFLGGEEELLSLDLVSAGWHIAYIDALAIHHYPSDVRDDGARRRLLSRNALWIAWMRRPYRAALARTLAAATRGARDEETRAALIEALRGLPWALRRRRAVPPDVERRLRQLERSGARSTR